MDKNAKNLLNEFIQERLHGNVGELETFDFKTLRDSGKFGCPGRNFDCDDTQIMRAVYVVLWGDLFPGLTFENFGYQKQYRGDTMNTFHTMFGRPIPDREGYFSGLEKYSPPGELREKVRHFSRLCSSVGNYVVLPNYYAEGTTLNCYRGTNEWHDFFDRFLRELRKVLTASQEQDALLQTLVRINDFCFGPFRSGEGFRTLIRELFLEEYCFEDGRVREVFPMNFHWMDTGAREQYLSDAGTYLEKSCSIIKNRSRRICEKLKTKLLSV